MRLLLIFAALSCALAQAHNVAIVGAGIGAAQAAISLRELIPNDLNIDVFEQSDRVGGRAFSLDIEGHRIEMGASIFHKENHLIARMAKIANLTPTAPQGSSETAGSDDLFALFDGTSIVFSQSPWKIITLIKLLWCYGLQPWYYKTAASNFLQQFQQIYRLQQDNNGTSFTRPQELLKKLDLFWLTQISFVEYIHDYIHSYSSFASEFVSAASLANYNQQNIDLNGLAGLVSLLPAVYPRLYSIKKGNQKLAEGAFAAAGAHVKLHSAVCGIAAVDGNGSFSTEKARKFKITLANCTDNSTCGDILYDAVIIATPFHSHPIGLLASSKSCDGGTAGDGGNFLNITGVESLPRLPRREYQKTVTTIIKGSIRPTYFGLPPGPMPFNSILVTEKGSSVSRVPFNSISKIASTSGFKGLYKIFSKESIPETWLSVLFDAGYEVVALQEWAGAYPKFDPPENFPKFELSTGLYYANALENAASAMEMAAISGKNVALLAAQYLSQKAQLSKERETPSTHIDGKSSISSGVELYRGGYKRDAAAPAVVAAAA